MSTQTAKTAMTKEATMIDEPHTMLTLHAAHAAELRAEAERHRLARAVDRPRACTCPGSSRSWR
jgi:hypothetical protein